MIINHWENIAPHRSLSHLKDTACSCGVKRWTLYAWKGGWIIVFHRCSSVDRKAQVLRPLARSRCPYSLVIISSWLDLEFPIEFSRKSIVFSLTQHFSQTQSRDWRRHSSLLCSASQRSTIIDKNISQYIKSDGFQCVKIDMYVLAWAIPADQVHVCLEQYKHTHKSKSYLCSNAGAQALFF